MRHSSSSTVLMLPFGSLMGSIPMDSVPLGCVRGDFSDVLAGSAQRPSEVQQQIHSAIDPARQSRVAAPHGDEARGDSGI